MIDLELDRTFITSQNHGYAVVNGSIPSEVGTVSHINANDGTCEGVRYTKIPALYRTVPPRGLRRSRRTPPICSTNLWI